MARTHETGLAPAPTSPGVARRRLEEWFGSELQRDDISTAKLLLSELVTNAVLHGRGQITVRATLDDQTLLIEVVDEGAGFDVPAMPVNPLQESGRGLWVVSSEASQWGVRGPATTVWFALERTPPQLTPRSDLPQERDRPPPGGELTGPAIRTPALTGAPATRRG